MPKAPLIGISIGAYQSRTSDATRMGVRATYPHAVEVGGGLPTLIPLYTDFDTLHDLFHRLDGIVLTGGGDIDPKHYGAICSPYTTEIVEDRDRVEIQLARWAVEEDKPLLAICRGIQVLNVALGGTLIQDIRDEVPDSIRHDADEDIWFERLTHEVKIDPDTKLHATLGEQTQLSVNSLHHQALAQVASPLKVVACAPDGIIEGVEVPDRQFAVGVQWHPEALVDKSDPMRQLFQSFVQAASQR
jgi:putative glutamine amidotransferase